MAKDRLPANRLRELREHQGISLEQLAAFCGVNVRTLYRWERGDSRIPDQQKALLCDLFGVSLDHLMRRDCAGPGCSRRDRDEGYEGTRPTKPDHNALAPPQTETPGGSPPLAGGFGFLLALIRRILRRPFLLLLMVVLVLAVAPIAEAHRHHCRRGHVLVHHRRRPHWRCVRRRVKVAVTPTRTPTPPPLPPSIIGLGDVPGCLWGVDPTPVLDFYRSAVGASMMRVVLPFYDSPVTAEPCVAAAKRDGFLVELAIQWDNGWTPTQIADRFRFVLGVLGSYVWAVGVGNEQELAQPSFGESSGQYAAAWRVAEPVVAAMVPSAIRVGGELSPWGGSWFQRAFAEGLPGMQALGAHPYAWAQKQSHGASPQDFVYLAHLDRLPLWDDEGLYVPDSPFNHVSGDRSVSDLAGSLVAAAWLVRPVTP